MSARVKGRRPYVSPRREEQARETRRRILAAARRLFAGGGYSSTTVDGIAGAAGVAVQTVYAAVGNKRDVLWAVLETAVAGDDAPDTLLDRVRHDLDGADGPGDRLQRAIIFGRETMERSADVHRIMRSAAGTDPDVATALEEVERRRYRDARGVMRLVAGVDGLADGVEAATATDVWYGVTSYEMYELLVVDRRWSATRYERWLERSMRPLLG